MNRRSLFLSAWPPYCSLLPSAAIPLESAGAWPTANSGPGPAPDLKLNNLPVGKLFVLGNSITHHGPKPEIGWTGNWGMAASAADKDFVHRLAAHIAKASRRPAQMMSSNIADFERGHTNYDIAAGMKDELAFKPDVVIVAIGENVPPLDTDRGPSRIPRRVRPPARRAHENSHPLIFVRSCFWPNPEKDELMKQAAAEAGAILSTSARWAAIRPTPPAANAKSTTTASPAIPATAECKPWPMLYGTPSSGRPPAKSRNGRRSTKKPPSDWSRIRIGNRPARRGRRSGLVQT